jgi:hypothetical protein
MKRIIVSAIYIASIFYCRLYMIAAKSPTGIWTTLKPDYYDMFICFVPAVNTIFTIEYFIDKGQPLNEQPSFFNNHTVGSKITKYAKNKN